MSRSDASDTLNSSWLHGPSLLTLAVAIVVILVSCTNSSVPLAEDMDPSLGPPNHEEVAAEAPASATHTTGVQIHQWPNSCIEYPTSDSTTTSYSAGTPFPVGVDTN